MGVWMLDGRILDSGCLTRRRMADGGLELLVSNRTGGFVTGGPLAPPMCMDVFIVLAIGDCLTVRPEGLTLQNAKCRLPNAGSAAGGISFKAGSSLRPLGSTRAKLPMLRLARGILPHPFHPIPSYLLNTSSRKSKDQLGFCATQRS